MQTNILIINPNSTTSMTREIKIAAERCALSGTFITAVNPVNGPASIQGPEDGAACLPGLFELFDQMVNPKSRFDFVIIACFDDTGVSELKTRSPIPVIGIGEAAFHAAALLGASFTTVTTLSVSIPVIEQNIVRYGFSAKSAKVRACEVAVLDIGSKTFRAITAEAHKAKAEDKCDVIVLGCAGMADLAKDLEKDLCLPVIDGVTMAVFMCEALSRARATC